MSELETTSGVWNDDLQCHLVAVEVRDDLTTFITVGEGHCPDMSGAIRLALSLNRFTATVYVHDGTELVNVYDRKEDAKWENNISMRNALNERASDEWPDEL